MDIKNRLETAQHILLRILMNEYSARQVAKEKYEDRIRLDVKSDLDLTQIPKEEIEQKVNNIINRKLAVKESFFKRAEIPQNIDTSLLPAGVEDVRVISIGDFDRQACDEQHVTNTSEIGVYKLIELKKIGLDTYRFVNIVSEPDQEGKGVTKIEPRLLKGFRDFLPDELRFRKAVFAVFERTFEKYGYEPLETPVLEYFDILMGKYGEEEKLVYQFDDHGGRRVAMKYDLTVPTARVLAQYQDKIKLPWKRYQIQPVWRADNTQKGRFREFYQCDADVLGSASMLVEAEFIKMAIEIISTLGFKEFIVRLNNRKILNAIAKFAGAEDKFYDLVYAVDKWEKRTPVETKEDMLKRGFTVDQVEKVFGCLTLKGDSSLEKLTDLEKKLQSVPEGIEGINELRKIIELVNIESVLKYDPTIARGLAYYTGPVWEIVIIEGGVGSVAGCGRYDKLISSFLGRDIPAAGGSFGIERLIEVMKDRNMLADLGQQNETVMVAVMEGFEKQAFELAEKLREQAQDAQSVYIYPDTKKLSKQLEFADKKGFTKVFIIGENEAKNGVAQIKDMQTGEQVTVEV